LNWLFNIEEVDSFMNDLVFIDSDLSGLHFVVRAVTPADEIQLTAVNFDYDGTSESLTNTEFDDAHDNMIDDDIDDIAADDDADDATSIEIGVLEPNRKARGRPLSSSTKKRGRRSSKISESLPDSVNKEASFIN